VTVAEDTTLLLLAAGGGDKGAIDELFGHVYERLRVIAHRELVRRDPGETLNTTALVHEAYLKLFDSSRLAVNDKHHFLAIAARAMRQVIVDHFRSRKASKRGGGGIDVDILSADIPIDVRGDVMLALDEALSKLSQLNSRLSDVVVYRFFGGMTQDEVAAVLGISERTVRRDWTKAQMWLSRELAA